MFSRKQKNGDADKTAALQTDLRAAAFDAIDMPLVVLGADGAVVQSNPSAAKLFGAAPEAGAKSATLWSAVDGKAVIGDRSYATTERAIDGGHTLVTFRAVVDNRVLLQSAEGRFRKAIETTQSKMRELQTFVTGITQAAEEAGQSAGEMDGKIEGVSSTFEIVAAAAQELDASISEITRQASQSSAEAEAAVERTEAANLTVRQLAESSERIGEVVGLIEEIAAQTNLLALNATIEAARAGEAGRGFAVVAAEVKNLAQQTTKATGDITQQISTIQSNIGDAVDAIDGINTTIKQISSVSTSIAGAVGQQSSATADISRNVQLAAENIRAVSESLGSVTRASRETPEQLRQVVSATDDAIRINDDLGGEMDAIVADIRRASA